MSGYNLTEPQKELLRLLVEAIQTNRLTEPIILAEWISGTSIAGLEEEFDTNLRDNMDALCDEDLLGFRFNSSAEKIYRIKQTGYDAVENNFSPQPDKAPAVSIGAIVNEMSGGNLQAIGLANYSKIEQIINDPDQYRAEINKISSELIEAIKTELMGNDLVSYLNHLEELKAELTSDEPDESNIKRLTSALAFLGDIEGTLSLATRVFPYLHALLILGSQMIN